MSATQARSTRVRDALLIALTFSTGAVDALTWLALGKVFSAFMTGNLVFLGVDAAGVAGPSVPRVFAAIVPFSIGASLGAVIVDGGPALDTTGVWPRRVTVVLAVVVAAQAAFVALWVAVGGTPAAATGHVLVAVSSLAMGMQTRAVLSLGVRAVFTTAATATVATLMGDVATWSTTRVERHRLAGVICALVAGAFAGAYLVVHARTWAPVLPLAVSGAVVAVARVISGAEPRTGSRTARPVAGTSLRRVRRSAS